MNNGFAIRPLSPLGHAADKPTGYFYTLLLCLRQAGRLIRGDAVSSRADKEMGGGIAAFDLFQQDIVML